MSCSPNASRYSQLTMSRLLKLVPMWPDPAFWIMYRVFRRASVANAAVRSTAGPVISRTRSNSLSGT